MGVPTRRGSARDAEPAGLGTQGPAQTAAATFKPRQRIRPGPEVPGAGGREGGREERPCEQTPPRARALASWGLESQLGSRSPDGPGAGGGGGNLRGGGSGGDGRPWRRVCLSRGRSLGAGDRGGGRAGEEGCGSAEAAATGTRRHHLSRLSRRGAAAGAARRRPARPGRCPSPSGVPAAGCPRFSRDSPALKPSDLLLPHFGAPIALGPGPPLLRRAFRPRPSAPPPPPGPP